VRLLLSLILLIVSPLLLAQGVATLKSELAVATHDSVKLRLNAQISEVCDYGEIEQYAGAAVVLADDLIIAFPDKRIEFLMHKATGYNNLGFVYDAYGELTKAGAVYEDAAKTYLLAGDSAGLALVYNNQAMLFKDQAETDKAIALLEKASDIALRNNDDDNLSSTYANLSTMYANGGQLTKAVEYVFLGMEIQERLKDSIGIGHSYNTISALYFKQNDYENARKYSEKAIKIQEQTIDSEGLSSSYNNYGFLLDYIDEDSLALIYYNKALELRRYYKDPGGIAESLSNLATYYLDEGDTAKGMEFLFEAVEIRENIEEIEGLSGTYNKLSGLYFVNGKMSLALEYGEKAIRFARRTGYRDDLMYSSQTLARIYEKLGRYKDALKMQKLYTATSDSLFNSETQRNLLITEMNHERSKELYADSLSDATKDEMNTLAFAKKQAEIDKATARNLGMSVGIFLLLGVVFIAFRAYRSKKQAAETIAIQKAEVEHKKVELEEKNKEITDSINYAKRIQDAILPTQEQLTTAFPESFTLYLPKDIVAGDFYWLERQGESTLFAVADCTGHGVPGAMVSVICNNALNQSTREHGHTEPSRILDKTCDLVIEQFEKGNEKVMDGMDIAMCRITGMNLLYSGANNALWILRDGEILETKATKQPIGKYDNRKHFVQHEIMLQKNDLIYLFSDGYVDQFGGIKGKKLKAANFKNLLLDVASLPMKEQHEALEAKFRTWMGEFEQIDDVCVWGIRV